MTTHKITIETPDGEQTFTCDEGTPILEAAEEAGLEIPSGCHSGVCSTCVHLIDSGSVDQSSQMALDPESVEQGFVVVCVGRPLSDVVLKMPPQDEG